VARSGPRFGAVVQWLLTVPVQTLDAQSAERAIDTTGSGARAPARRGRSRLEATARLCRIVAPSPRSVRRVLVRPLRGQSFSAQRRANRDTAARCSGTRRSGGAA
jgi:hypothetical protein